MTLPILGIDPALTCGWALRFPDGRYESGIWRLKGDRFEGGGMPLVRLRGKLRELLALQQVERVVIERAPSFSKGASANQWAAAILGTVMATCEELQVPYTTITAASVKAFVTGKANAKKELATAKALERWPGYAFATPDESDARWVAEAAAAGR